MKPLLCLLPLAFLTSCESLSKLATYENLDRALIIYDAGSEIYRDSFPITPEK